MKLGRHQAEPSYDIAEEMGQDVKQGAFSLSFVRRFSSIGDFEARQHSTRSQARDLHTCLARIPLYKRVIMRGEESQRGVTDSVKKRFDPDDECRSRRRCGQTRSRRVLWRIPRDSSRLSSGQLTDD